MNEFPKIELRVATPRERPAIEAACRETCDRHVAKLPFAFPANTFEFFHGKYIASCFTTPEGRDRNAAGTIQAAFHDGEFAGYVILVQSSLGGSGLEIFDIHVFAPHRRKGVGRALIEWCEHRVKILDAQNLHATAWMLEDDREAFFEAAGMMKLCEVFRAGPDQPAWPYVSPEEMPENRPSWVHRALREPQILWGIIVMLAIALAAT
ncbi:GNAT family N-acetyltransferase [Vannielia sp.]|uniref:GNAT family N-acetyltransferase n=1 Tax=Vannielia sp. TaxID=2813045 RepID=UPI0026233F94|nr:GNAT family N-acetyltransferase [Vannielia sp.]MDF1871226.1 GNAT family N-acetyltransferase [Vannielia sp.]